MPNPTFQQVISLYEQQYKNYISQTHKIPKHSRTELVSDDGSRYTFVLPYSLFKHGNKWFMIKRHTSQEKQERAEKAQTGNMLLSKLVEITDMNAVMPTREELRSKTHTKIKKSWFMPEEHTKKQLALNRTSEVTKLTTAAMQAVSENSTLRADCLYRATTSQKHKTQQYKTDLLIDFVAGMDLVTLYERHRPENFIEVLDIIIEIVKGVKLLHAAGIVNGDIKLEHFIMDISSDGKYKLKTIIDHEFAGRQETASGRGTYEYAAPAVFTQKTISFFS